MKLSYLKENYTSANEIEQIKEACEELFADTEYSVSELKTKKCDEEVHSAITLLSMKKSVSNIFSHR